MTQLQDTVKRLFEFLKQLYKINNPVQRNIDKASAILQLADIESHQVIEYLTTQHDVACNEGLVILRVSRPKITECLAPPEELLPWLLPGWERFGCNRRTYRFFAN